MKQQAHIPTICIGARDWRPGAVALAALLGASALLLAAQSSFSLNNPPFERLLTASAVNPQIGVFDRVSLDIHSLGDPIDPATRFSVARPQPAYVASPQPFSIGLESRVAFEVFGETAHSELLTDERTLSDLQQRDDRLMLMLMLLRLRPHRD